MNKERSGTTLLRQEKNFEYFGAGVPAVISYVTFESFGSDWIPLLDYEAVEEFLARKVATKVTRLTGDDVRFLRQWLEISMADLAGHFGYTAPAVHKWQQRRSRAAGMHWTAETQLRLLVLDKLGVTPTAFRSAFRSLAKQLPEAEATPIYIPGAKVAAKRATGKPAKPAANTKAATHTKRAA
jgi:DNA-binding transcriptional regulator YiaG